ncbi:DUF5304 domain-containing protein [Streptomyces sp. AC563]|uniref:DUF5304 domain-containing protein n=1 Tax=Streptomyces buecherae TaxID=2763006 RepID=UPI00164D669B|nr:DUF5304 domain-containing protein [Streptomyces buecherae]MBC3988637.1 DUF5304 domain-containing protein [Streptomyces buecherae]
MSDATERPDDAASVPGPASRPGADGPAGDRPRPDDQDTRDSEPRRAPDPGAWEQACAEDLDAERARRRDRYGPQQVSAAEELRKLAETVTNKLSSLQGPIAGVAAQTVVRQLVGQAKAVVEPVIERNPDVFDHLATAGTELLAAARAAVSGQEQRWTRGDDEAARGAAPGAATEREDDDRRDDTPPGSEHIDLD